MNRKEIGAKIECLRKDRRMSQYRLAMDAGLSTSYIHDIEKGLKCPTVEVLDSICYALNISLSDFFSETKEKANQNCVETLSVQQKKLLNAFLDSLL